jgi:hypothetical protein
MSVRLSSRVTVDALLRRAAQQGGFGAVLARGDEGAGAVLVLLVERGAVRQLLERSFDFATERYRWMAAGPQDVESDANRDAYIQRRRERDRDLWLVELDIADAERFAAEMMAVC